MPVSLTTLGRPGARDCAPDVLPSTMGNASASQKYVVFEAQWLAYALPYRRFTPAFTDDGARLGADVVRYSFIVMDLHHLLLAGFTGAHPSYRLPMHASRRIAARPMVRDGAKAAPPHHEVSCGRATQPDPLALSPSHEPCPVQN